MEAGLGPQGFQGVGACSGRLLLRAGWQEEEEDLMWVGGGREEKKMSNAMSHSALAGREGEQG